MHTSNTMCTLQLTILSVLLRICTKITISTIWLSALKKGSMITYNSKTHFRYDMNQTFIQCANMTGS